VFKRRQVETIYSNMQDAKKNCILSS